LISALISGIIVYADQYGLLLLSAAPPVQLNQGDLFHRPMGGGFTAGLLTALGLLSAVVSPLEAPFKIPGRTNRSEVQPQGRCFFGPWI
jgi:hypothetical protein